MSQATNQWGKFAPAFYQDGSLRDICILNTLRHDWANAISFISTQKYKTSFSGAWAQQSPPSDIASLFPTGPDSEFTLLSIDLSGIIVNCHFFTEDQIEFDVNPSDVNSPERLDELFNFMKGLANAVGKDVILTGENEPESPLFRCSPQCVVIEYMPTAGP
jgi:hypothetical protein